MQNLSELHSCLLNKFLQNKFIVTDYQLIPYTIKLKVPYQKELKTPHQKERMAPWKTSNSSIHYRQGLLVRLIINKSLSITGECAPMPEIGTENLFQAQQFLQKKLPSLIGKPLGTDILSDMQALTACRFALETALLSLVATLNETNIAQLLNPEPAREVKVNAMLGSLDTNLITRAKQAEAQGFGCLKIKVGLSDIESEAAVLSNLLKQISPATVIRLDANKSWTLEQTEWLLGFLQHKLEAHISQIDSIEEPLTTYNEKKYQYLQSKTTIALALDESFSSTSSLVQFPVRRLVLKPMAQGGIINTYHLARQVQEYKIETVFTSSIETGYGLWPIAYLCCAINNKQFHGLATAPWLENTLIKPPEIKHGTISL